MALIPVVTSAIRSDMPPLAQATERESGLPWWGWLLIVIVLAWLLTRWLARRTPSSIRPAATSTRPEFSAVEPKAAVADAPVEAPVREAVEPVAMAVEVPPAAPVDAPAEAPAMEAGELAAMAVEVPPAAPVEDTSLESVAAVGESPSADAETPPEPGPVSPDDLTIVEGIGPRIAALLIASGIRTFSQLAATDTDRLRQILLEVGYRVNDPTTWPEQAGLAAIGEWDRLKVLQGELKGGRRA